MFLLKKNSNFFLNLKANFSRFEKRDGELLVESFLWM